MNCLEFRRQKLADPYLTPAGQVDHLAGCSVCSDFFKRADRLENDLQTAIHLSVPDGLSERILLGVPPRPSHHLRWYAAAAVLVLAVALVIINPLTVAESRLASAVIAHVRHDPEVMIKVEHVQEVDLHKALAASGASMRSSLGAVRYLGKCPVPGGIGEHIVIQTPMGLATLILMPSQPLSSRVVSTDQGLTAVVSPAGKGSYAVVAESLQQAGEFSRWFSNNIDWGVANKPNIQANKKGNPIKVAFN